MAILGIGTDIVECPRIADMIERHQDIFLTRVFTAAEIEYCRVRKASIQHYSGRWAAKEAVLKALGTGWRRGISWRDIEIVSNRQGAPICHLHGGAREVQERAGIRHMHVSISHSRYYAIAYAIAEGEEH